MTVLVAGASVEPWAAAWAASPSGATISLENAQLVPGQRVSVTLAGWNAPNVNLSVCGNLARRGSADCNVTASQDAQLVNGSSPTVTYLFVFAPPTTCPCVVRASTADQGEVVFAPIELVGVPVGPVVGAAFGTPISVSIISRAAVRGFFAAIRSTLGGPTAYRVTVTLRNLSPERIPTVSLAGSAGRGGTDMAVSFDIPSPGAIEPGQTWEHDLRVSVPAPMLGRAAWRVVVSGAGAPAEATTVTHRAPVGLYVLAAAFAGDVAAMVWYFTARKLARRRSAAREVQEDGALPRLPVAPQVTHP